MSSVYSKGTLLFSSLEFGVFCKEMYLFILARMHSSDQKWQLSPHRIKLYFRIY